MHAEEPRRELILASTGAKYIHVAHPDYKRLGKYIHDATTNPILILGVINSVLYIAARYYIIL